MVLNEAKRAINEDKLGYTNALGILPLRQAIAKHYLDKYNVKISPDQVLITTGSSAAFLFTFLGCFDPQDCIALCSSGYPCYRNLMKATNLNAVSIPVNSEYKVTAKELLLMIKERSLKNLPPLKGLILSSPSNPTGAMLTPDELKELTDLCKVQNILFISDEIYHGISYGSTPEASALQFSSSSCIVINSFSKYYSMTGWRLGWMVVPLSLVDTMNRLSQNMYINAPTLSQIAACKAFDCNKQLDSYVNMYKVNREIVLEALQELGLLSGAAPADGAFYIYIDLQAAGVTDSMQLCHRLLEEAGVALTPGVDFEDPENGLGLKRIRFCYARSTEDVREGMRRFKIWWAENMVAKD